MQEVDENQATVARGLALPGRGAPCQQRNHKTPVGHPHHLDRSGQAAPHGPLSLPWTVCGSNSEPDTIAASFEIQEEVSEISCFKCRVYCFRLS
jgi:hypothetical protein